MKTVTAPIDAHPGSFFAAPILTEQVHLERSHDLRRTRTEVRFDRYGRMAVVYTTGSGAQAALDARGLATQSVQGKLTGGGTSQWTRDPPTHPTLMVSYALDEVLNAGACRRLRQLAHIPWARL